MPEQREQIPKLVGVDAFRQGPMPGDIDQRLGPLALHMPVPGGKRLGDLLMRFARMRHQEGYKFVGHYRKIVELQLHEALDAMFSAITQ